MINADRTTEGARRALDLGGPPAPESAASVTHDFERWERLLLAEDDLADVPPIPSEAMRRENLYRAE